MLKKILYIIVAIVFGFIIFKFSWDESYSRAHRNKAKKAVSEENYEFFCKYYTNYLIDPIFTDEYNKDDNTTKVICYSVFSESTTETVTENNKEKEVTVPRSGMMIIITNINKEVIAIDAEDLPEDDEDSDEDVKYSTITITANNGMVFTENYSTYDYDSINATIFTFSENGILKKLVDETHTDAPTAITHITFKDAEDKVFFDNEVNVPLVEHNEKEYWNDLVEQGIAGVKFSKKEASEFAWSFPEMNRTIIITAVALLIEVGLGLFIFWPKKSYVPTEEVDRETYTFASTEEKENIAIAKVARAKKEKEERENRYKNVRKDNNLEDMSNQAVRDSLGKENTYEAALEADALEEKAKEESSTTNENETIEETKEEK